MYIDLCGVMESLIVNMKKMRCTVKVKTSILY